MEVKKLTSRGVLALTLSGFAMLGLGGCASDSSALEKEGTTYLVTGLGDDRGEALDNAKEQALEKCEALDRESFTVVEQRILSPGEQASQDEASLSGVTVTEETDFDGLTADEDEYTAAWTIRCN